MERRVVTESYRLAFLSGGDKGDYYEEIPIRFNWYMGMSWQVRQRSSISMRESIEKEFPGKTTLEVSTASEDYQLGRKLSALNLTLGTKPVECLFQGSKVFSDNTGPFTDLYDVDPKTAKADHRIKTDKNRRVVGFKLRLRERGLNLDFASFPYSAFYDYIYILALNENKEIARKVVDYDFFTDINFNQKAEYSSTGKLNCQARAVAIYRSLVMRNELAGYLESPEEFFPAIYRHLYTAAQSPNEDNQASLF